MFFDLPLLPVIAAGSLGLLLLSCWHDVAVRTLPDGCSIAIAFIGILSESLYGNLPLSLLFGSLVFFFLVVAWYFGVLGGGDVKLLSACALLVGAPAIPVLLLATTISGGFLASVYLVGRRWPPQVPSRGGGMARRVWRAELRRIGRGGPLPYALAIASGTLFTLMDRV